jgi:LysR family transcriptional regulator for bpeEF and oprC
MDRLQAMQAFVRVVDTGSFTRAADSLGVPRTNVTTTIQFLERQLHVRLLNRTTRSVSMTPDGVAYYESCVRILADIDETEAAFRQDVRGPKGRLRVDMPPSYGRLVVLPRVAEFRARYPDIELLLGMTDRLVDLAQEAVDCVIRVGGLQDSSLVARRIASYQSVICAAPSYLKQYGEPRSVEDLPSHQAVQYFSNKTGRNMDWEFVVDGAVTPIKVNGMVAVNDAEAYMECALQGLGLVQPPRFMAHPYLQSGALQEILPEVATSSVPISIMYLQNRHLSPKVRVFVDWIAEVFASCELFGSAH